MPRFLSSANFFFQVLKLMQLVRYYFNFQIFYVLPYIPVISQSQMLVG